MLEDQINRLNEIDVFEQSARHQKAKKILEFIDSGGWIICGYESFQEMYEKNPGKMRYSCGHYLHLIIGVNYELLLQIPLGSYIIHELNGVRAMAITSNAYDRYNKELKRGTSCLLKNVAKTRDRFAKIQEFTEKQLPSQEEIKDACQQLFNVEIKYRNGGVEFYHRKIQELEKQVFELTSENQQLKIENAELKEKLKKPKMVAKSLYGRY